MTETLVEQKSQEMPVEIRRAVAVLLLCLLLSVVATITHWHLTHHHKAPVFTAVIIIAADGFFALLIWEVAQGRNWARITWLVFFVCGGLVNLLALASPNSRARFVDSPSSVVIFVVQTALQFYAALLLCTSKGRAWFRRRDRTPITSSH